MYQAAKCELGFGRVNTLMGSPASTISNQYIWDDHSVALKNSYFDEAVYRRSKINGLLKEDSCLSISDLQEVVQKVFSEQSQLILDISYAGPDNWKILDKQMDTLLTDAVAEAENEAELRISRNKIKAARPLSDGWMSYQDVNAMLELSNRRKFEAPDRAKFINQNR